MERKTRERISDRGHKSEAEISALHMSAFRAEGSPGLRFIQGLCPGRALTRESLIVLAKVFSAISGIHFPRDFTRRRDLIIKWFNDNMKQLETIGAIVTVKAADLEVPHGPGDEYADAKSDFL